MSRENRNNSAIIDDYDDANWRRKELLDNFKTVKEFSQSNIPLLIEGLCDNMGDQLTTIRLLESRVTS